MMDHSVKVSFEPYDLEHHRLVVEAVVGNKDNFHRGWVVLNEAQIGHWELVCGFAAGGYKIIKQKRIPGI